MVWAPRNAGKISAILHYIDKREDDDGEEKPHQLNGHQFYYRVTLILGLHNGWGKGTRRRRRISTEISWNKLEFR